LGLGGNDLVILSQTGIREELPEVYSLELQVLNV